MYGDNHSNIQVDNVMQISAAPGMGDVNTSMCLHPWSSTLCSDFPFPSLKTCWFKISFPPYDQEAKENHLLRFSVVFTEGGGRMVLQCFCHG